MTMTISTEEETLVKTLEGYKAIVHGVDKAGYMGVEFRSMHSAASWVATWEMEHETLAQTPGADKALYRPFADPVVIYFELATWYRKCMEISQYE